MGKTQSQRGCSKGVPKLPKVVELAWWTELVPHITRCLAKKGPTQTRLHCKIATVNQKARYANVGYPNAQYSPEQPIGQNTIRKIMKEACLKLGYESSGHAFRRVFLTTIVNAEGVNTEEALALSCHNSVAAQRTYMVRGHESEAAKFKVFGL